MRAFSLDVVGAAHPNKSGPSRRFEIEICRAGEPIELRLEPKNPADPNAVAVHSCRGIQIGYLRAERAPLIGGRIRAGMEVQAIYQHRAEYGAVIRVAFDGEAPTLDGVPTEPHKAPIEPDFYPDEIYPDD